VESLIEKECPAVLFQNLPHIKQSGYTKNGIKMDSEEDIYSNVILSIIVLLTDQAVDAVNLIL
jgi:hypothetical protein